MNSRSDLGAFFRSDRPPLELNEYRRTYRRTRIWANLAIIAAILILGGHFEHAQSVVGGIIALSGLILLHSTLRSRSSLLEMIAFDTVLYLTMTVVADTAEVALFVGMAQSFMLFQFVAARVALVATIGFMLLATMATTLSVTMDLQVRSPADTLLLVTVVTWVTTIPVALIQLKAGAESHHRREQQEQLAVEKDHLLQDKDRFVASISHELRTPLTAVVAVAHTLHSAIEAITPDEKDELLAMLVEHSEEVTAIVDDLLVAARAQTGHLSLVVENVDLVDQLRAVASPHLEVVADGTAQHIAVGDPIRVRQILRNLISNAERYGGERVWARVSTDGALARVDVADDGEPLSSESAAMIFDAYGRAHDRPGQTDSVGLGLTVSRQLARLMGGDVTYFHDGEWTVFSLTLPAGTAGTTAAIKAAPETALLAHRALADR